MSAHPLPLPQPPPLPSPPPYHPHPPFTPLYPTSPFYHPGYYPNHGTPHWSLEPNPIPTHPPLQPPNLSCPQPTSQQHPSIKQSSIAQIQPTPLPPTQQTHQTKQPSPSSKQPILSQPNSHHHTPEPIKQPNTIQIDNKLFQFSWGGGGMGRTHPFCITERKFKTTLGKIWLGPKDMVWLGNTIDMAASKATGWDFF